METSHSIEGGKAVASQSTALYLPLIWSVFRGFRYRERTESIATPAVGLGALLQFITILATMSDEIVSQGVKGGTVHAFARGVSAYLKFMRQEVCTTREIKVNMLAKKTL